MTRCGQAGGSGGGYGAVTLYRQVLDNVCMSVKGLYVNFAAVSQSMLPRTYERADDTPEGYASVIGRQVRAGHDAA